MRKSVGDLGKTVRASVETVSQTVNHVSGAFFAGAAISDRRTGHVGMAMSMARHDAPNGETGIDVGGEGCICLSFARAGA